MEFRASVVIKAPAEKVWKVLMDGDAWSKWFTTGVEFNNDGGQRSIYYKPHDGIMGMSFPISTFVEGEAMTIKERFSSNYYTLRPVSGGTEFTLRIEFAPGMSMPMSSQEKERAKWQDRVEQFAALVMADKSDVSAASNASGGNDYQKQGLCRYCGGAFKGFFRKKCVKCGKPKDY